MSVVPGALKALTGLALALAASAGALAQTPLASAEDTRPRDALEVQVVPDATPAEAAQPVDAPIEPGIEPMIEIREPFKLAAPLDLTLDRDDLWDRIRTGFAMPELRNPLVSDRERWYAARPDMLRVIFDRSRRYLYHIVEELEKRGMPTELALLPMVESAFNPMAYSRAQASGLWQFIPSTGKRYELAQNAWYDARRDVIASTTAALDYLEFLYDMHGDWFLALASYNWGENAVARAIEHNRAKGLPAEYVSLRMPEETRYYVPKLQALKNIVAHPSAFGVSLAPIPNQPYFLTVEKDRDIDITTAAKLAEMPVAELVALNPAFNRPVIATAQSRLLALPADRVDTFFANLARHDEPLSDWRRYVFKKGDRLDKLAKEHGVTPDKLRQANGISPRTALTPGFELLLPVKGSRAALEPLPAVLLTRALPAPPPSPPLAPARQVTREVIERIVHTVARGETLYSIAARYQVGVDDLRRWNAIGRLLAGQKLVIEQVRSVTTLERAPRVQRTSAQRAPVRKPARQAPRRVRG